MEDGQREPLAGLAVGAVGEGPLAEVDDMLARGVAVEDLEDVEILLADLVAIHVPMHTASRLAVPLVARVPVDTPSTHADIAPFTTTRVVVFTVRVVLVAFKPGRT